MGMNQGQMFEYMKAFSKPIQTVMMKFYISMFVANTSVSHRIKDVIISVLPLALTVAGSILVVKLAWRMFRNFTKG